MGFDVRLKHLSRLHFVPHTIYYHFLSGRIMTDRDGTGWDVRDGSGRVITDRDRFVCMAGQFRVQNWPVDLDRPGLASRYNWAIATIRRRRRFVSRHLSALIIFRQ